MFNGTNIVLNFDVDQDIIFHNNYISGNGCKSEPYVPNVSCCCCYFVCLYAACCNGGQRHCVFLRIRQGC